MRLVLYINAIANETGIHTINRNRSRYINFGFNASPAYKDFPGKECGRYFIGNDISITKWYWVLDLLWVFKKR